MNPRVIMISNITEKYREWELTRVSHKACRGKIYMSAYTGSGLPLSGSSPKVIKQSYAMKIIPTKSNYDSVGLGSDFYSSEP